jgi:hypothetical protein
MNWVVIDFRGERPLREIDIQSDNCIVVMSVGLCLVALGLCAFSTVQQTVLQATGFALAGVSVLFLAGTALYEIGQQLWSANVEAARRPEIMRQVLRVVNTWRLLRSRWDELDNAGRGAFDPAVESLLQSGKLDIARKLASEKLVVAHAAGEADREKVYRRYVKILERMQEAA